jgi:hypothetical protein
VNASRKLPEYEKLDPDILGSVDEVFTLFDFSLRVPRENSRVPKVSDL